MALAAVVAGELWPAGIAAAMVVTVWAAVTGALHLDGLADCFDALAAAVPPARRLEILRDLHVGAFAVVGAVLFLLLKWTAVAALLGAGPGALLLPPVAGRAMMAWAQDRWPYAREEGLGSLLPPVPGSLLLNALPLVIVALALGWRGVLSALVGLLLGHIAAACMARLLGGGLTGDSYGALCELTELFVLLGLTLRLRIA